MEAFINAYVNTLAAPCGVGDTTVNVTLATPWPTDGSTFRLRVDDEVMLVTGVAGNVATVTRGAEGSTAVAHAMGATVTNILTAGAMEQLVADLHVTEIMLVAGVQSTTSTASFQVAGVRTIDMTKYPAKAGNLSRHMQFVATLQSTAGATECLIQLFDLTHAVVVTGTMLNNSAAPSLPLPFDVNSGDLTVGTASGNIRSDVAAQYEVQIKMVGGGSTDLVICSNARIIVFYQ